MLNFILDLLITLPQLVIAGWVLGKYIETRKFRQFFVLVVLSQLLCYAFTGYVVESYGLRAFLALGIQVLLILCYTRISRTQALAFFAVANSAMFIFEVPMDLLLFTLVPDFSSVAAVEPGLLMAWKIAVVPTIFLAFVLPYWFFTKYVKKVGSQTITRYLPFFLLQLPMIIFPVVCTLAVSRDYVLINIVSVGYLVVNIVLDLLLMGTFERIDRTHELERREEQARALLKAQVDYYEQHSESARATRQLRHDMKNQLTTLSILLDEEDYDTARQQLSSFREKINRASEPRYTGNAVVDAVIRAKVDACAETGIIITCSGSLPLDLKVEPVSLCSIVANLLDNAIHALGKLPPSEEPVIEFSAGIKDGKAVFLCRNPAPENALPEMASPSLHQEHGWGLNILRQIAGEYGGDMTIRQEGSIVTAVLWLKL